MKSTVTIIVCIFLLLLFCAKAAVITGSIVIIWPYEETEYKKDETKDLRLLLRIYRKDVGIPSISKLYRTPHLQQMEFPITPISTTQITYSVKNVEANGTYFLFAFVTTSSSPTTTSIPLIYQGMAGWYSNNSLCAWLSPLPIPQNAQVVEDVNFEISGSRSYTKNPRTKISSPTDPNVLIGKLSLQQGFPVLLLSSASSYERGFAHGFLIAEQIVDFFKYYILQSEITSCANYLRYVAPGIQSKFHYTQEYLKEAQGIIDGMKASKVDMFIRGLQRDFELVDVLAINGYGAVGDMVPSPSAAEAEQAQAQQQQTEQCSQFSLWGSKTQNSKLQGNTISGRNMDAELDIRRVTVTHFLIYAVDPTGGKKQHKRETTGDDGNASSSSGTPRRYASFMWPGFIGTYSGVNEDGTYLMMNAGSRHDGMTYQNATFTTTFVRSILMNEQAADVVPEMMLGHIQQYQSSTGGSCIRGCVLFFSTPASLHRSTDTPVSFIYEGDFMGGMMRVPGQAEPRELPDEVMQATNHFHLYGVDQRSHDATINFGKQVPFASTWRYMASTELIRGVHHTNPGSFDEASMQRILQTVSYGETEHSVMYSSSVSNNGQVSVRFWVAVANRNQFTAWDAAYQEFAHFDFEQIFQ